ncbi:hypothetical protein [Streptomyces sp. NPDC004728]|uniref:hypothetical protein n=1 Tax=Streptomyces sp. NPDC004728 TaxID=3154289 RepID=UPI0033AC7780
MVDRDRVSIGTSSGQAGKGLGFESRRRLRRKPEVGIEAGIQVGVEIGILARGVKYP